MRPERRARRCGVTAWQTHNVPKIGVDDLSRGVLGDLLHRPGQAISSVVDHDVQSAERIGGRLDSGEHRGPVADVQRESDQPALGPGLQLFQLPGLPDGSRNHVAAGQRGLGK